MIRATSTKSVVLPLKIMVVDQTLQFISFMKSLIKIKWNDLNATSTATIRTTLLKWKFTQNLHFFFGSREKNFYCM